MLFTIQPRVCRVTSLSVIVWQPLLKIFQRAQRQVCFIFLLMLLHFLFVATHFEAQMLIGLPFHLRVVSLCISPVNDSFMSGSLDHSVRIWDLRVNVCQVGYQSWVELSWWAHYSNQLCLVCIYEMKDALYPLSSFMLTHVSFRAY